MGHDPLLLNLTTLDLRKSAEAVVVLKATWFLIYSSKAVVVPIKQCHRRAYTFRDATAMIFDVRSTWQGEASQEERNSFGRHVNNTNAARGQTSGLIFVMHPVLLTFCSGVIPSDQAWSDQRPAHEESPRLCRHSTSRW